MVSRTMLKYEEMRRRMSSVSRASRSVSSYSWWEGEGGYLWGRGGGVSRERAVVGKGLGVWGGEGKEGGHTN